MYGWVRSFSLVKGYVVWMTPSNPFERLRKKSPSHRQESRYSKAGQLVAGGRGNTGRHLPQRGRGGNRLRAGLLDDLVHQVERAVPGLVKVAPQVFPDDTEHE